MVNTVTKRVRVEADGSIRIQSSALRPGDEVEVIVRTETRPAESDRMTWSRFLGGGRGLSRDVQEIDRYVDELRDDWEERR